MVRFLGLVTSVLLVLTCLTVAQENPKAEIFGGYQYTHVSPGQGFPGDNLNGWNASVSGYFNKYLGISADFSGIYGNVAGVSTHVYPYLFGPIVRFPNSSKITPFAHALFGAAHSRFSDLGLSTTDNSFAMAFGGGLDANINSRFAVRLAQADYLHTQLFDSTQHNFRYSAGIVIKF
jgi:opacity protein-like surface antigen